MPATVSAIVVAFRSADHLPALLADLDDQGVEEVVVVDNASPDDSAAAAVAALPRLRLVQEAENRGFAAGVNAGVAASTGDLLLLVNPDVRLLPGAIAALRAAAAVSPKRVHGPLVRDLHGRVLPTRRSLPSLWTLLGEEVIVREGARPGDWPQRLWARWRSYAEPAEAPVLSGVCLLVPRLAWSRAGSFDEGYFLYWEEVDWQLRARSLGHETWLTPQAEVIHVRSASLGLHDPRRAALMGSSTRRFLLRHLPAGQRTIGLLLVSLGQAARWTLWTAARPFGGGRRAEMRRRQHAAWLRGAWTGGGS